MNNIIDLSALEISNKIRAGELSALEVTKAFIARINNLEKKLDAFNCVMEKEALSRAGEIDARIKAGDASGELLGVPVAVKDNLMIKGVKTTCSSKILENYTAPYNATVIEKLEKEGAVFVGKTNLDEFAMGSSTENSAFKTTKNPWDIQRVPGGSSGGSACAVAAKMAPLALGSDTGGCIRQPASLCGVVGLKPTYGSVRRFGLVAFASSLDQIGPFARTVEDSALLFKLISGHDSKDSTSAKIEPREFIGDMKKDIKGLRVGLPKEYFIDGVDKEVNDSVRAALKVLEGLGAVIEEISLPHTQYATAVYYIIAPSEASANLARYDGVKYGFSYPGNTMWESMEKTRGQGFGPEVKRRIMLGTYALS